MNVASGGVHFISVSNVIANYRIFSNLISTLFTVSEG